MQPKTPPFFHSIKMPLVPGILLYGIAALILPAFIYAAERGTEPLLDQALRTVGLDKEKVSIRSDLWENPHSLPLFHQWMGSPLKAPGEAQRICRDLLGSAPDGSTWLQTLAACEAPVNLEIPSQQGTRRWKIPKGLPQPLHQAINMLLSAMEGAGEQLRIATHGIGSDELPLIEEHLFPEWAVRGNDQEEASGVWKYRDHAKAIRIAGKIERIHILKAGTITLDALEKAKSLLLKDTSWYGKIHTFSFSTPLGKVIVGGKGPDLHRGPAALIIDIGGGDTYQGQVASGIRGKCSVVLDLSGNDLYNGGDMSQGTGILGIGILRDLEGDDTYLARRGAQGAGFFGLGLLLDEKGSDRYLGEEFVQAASAWGWGGLLDLEGDDLYQCDHKGQAYSETMGISSLCDLEGDDRYLSGAGLPDPREPDMSQSFAQGFSMGLRNLAAGGLAFLVDGKGNDLYQVQYFGQGASYWMGIGVLYDQEGQDTYLARRYAQGAGIHFSLGLLLDVQGNDRTVSWLVSQGCGHDYGIGMLVNETGNDIYHSGWLSMGASEANGIGIFVDNTGDDGYETPSGLAVGRDVKGQAMSGLGLFLDAGGRDRYSFRGGDGKEWSDNRSSIGIDREADGESGIRLTHLGDRAPLGKKAMAALLKEQSRLSRLLTHAANASLEERIREILSVASHWGFEKDLPSQAQLQLFSMDPRLSIPIMADLLDTPDVLAQIFLREFLLAHGYYSLDTLCRKSTDPDPVIRARAIACLGLLKDSRGMASCLASLRDASWRVRANAVKAIGEILAEKRAEILREILEILESSKAEGKSESLQGYLQGEERMPSFFPLIACAIPVPYKLSRRYLQGAQGEERIELLEEFSRLTLDHQEDLLGYLHAEEKVLKDSSEAARLIETLFQDPDPFVRETASHSLQQMGYPKQGDSRPLTIETLREK